MKKGLKHVYKKMKYRCMELPFSNGYFIIHLPKIISKISKASE